MYNETFVHIEHTFNDENGHYTTVVDEICEYSNKRSNKYFFNKKIVQF
jgi:hypothetical protein